MIVHINRPVTKASSDLGNMKELKKHTAGARINVIVNGFKDFVEACCMSSSASITLALTQSVVNTRYNINHTLTHDEL